MRRHVVIATLIRGPVSPPEPLSDEIEHAVELQHRHDDYWDHRHVELRRKATRPIQPERDAALRDILDRKPTKVDRMMDLAATKRRIA